MFPIVLFSTPLHFDCGGCPGGRPQHVSARGFRGAGHVHAGQAVPRARGRDRSARRAFDQTRCERGGFSLCVVCCVLCAVLCCVGGWAVSLSVSVFVDFSSRLVNVMRVSITL